MKWVVTWLHPDENKTGKLRGRKYAEVNPERVKEICSDLSDAADPVGVEMLMEKGFSDEEVEEFMKAVNILYCQASGDIDFQVEKMMAEGVLASFGYQSVEQYLQELQQYSAATGLAH